MALLLKKYVMPDLKYTDLQIIVDILDVIIDDNKRSIGIVLDTAAIKYDILKNQKEYSDDINKLFQNDKFVHMIYIGIDLVKIPNDEKQLKLYKELKKITDDWFIKIIK